MIDIRVETCGDEADRDRFEGLFDGRSFCATLDALAVAGHVSDQRHVPSLFIFLPQKTCSQRRGEFVSDFTPSPSLESFLENEARQFCFSCHANIVAWSR